VVFTGAGPGEDASPELLMMVLVGGRGRTLDEFREMAREAGLEVGGVLRQPSGRVVVECRPAIVIQQQSHADVSVINTHDRLA